MEQQESILSEEQKLVQQRKVEYFMQESGLTKKDLAEYLKNNENKTIEETDVSQYKSSQGDIIEQEKTNKKKKLKNY